MYRYEPDTIYSTMITLLGSNEISVAGAVAMADALKCNQQLKELNLCNDFIQCGSNTR
jgi:hypothetical protein